MYQHGIAFRKIWLIGCGGIGSWIVPPLAKYLASMESPPGLDLIDGDRVEEKNCLRQNFYEADISNNKAEVFAEAVSSAYPNLTAVAYPMFWNGEGEDEPGDSENLLILAGPDNHVCRRRIFEELESCITDTVAIVGGNEDHDGCILVASDTEDRAFDTSIIRDRHPEVFTTEDGDRATMSCADLAALPSGAQTMAANYMAASLMFNYAVMALGGTVPPTETYFDAKTGAVRIVEEG